MENWYSGEFGLSKKKKNRGVMRVEEELDEDQVWDVLKQRQMEDSKVFIKKYKENDEKVHQWRHPAAPKLIPRKGKEGNLYNHQLLSAPLDILPQWSKIYDGGGDDDDNDEDDDDEGMIPPHEYIARRVARSEVSSFSMCEGIGRTLKGRDLSKLRNAILSKTGFLE